MESYRSEGSIAFLYAEPFTGRKRQKWEETTMEFSSVNTIWVLLGAALVFFMQAGFSMCEAGFTRAKNTGNILMKNLMDFCIGTPCFWLVGFGIMFGAGTGLFGWFDPMIMKDYSSILPSGVPLWAYAIFQTVFCATSATIVSGAMAERTKFSAYCIYSAAISLLIYPISGHWIWGGGWLSELGFHDFAGSTCVHMVGGVCALIGAKMLGPRIGKYVKDGKPRAILGHNLTFAALGVFILWFCWFGFNGASTVGMDTDELIVSAGLVFFNTNLCTAVACCTTLIFTWLRYGKPDVSMTYNAALAGLVGITAGCDAVSPLGAAVMGIVFGLVIVLAVEFFDKVAKIDDPVGAISVHGVCGALGTILTGLFATGVSTEKGVFYGGGFHFFGVQCLGVASVILYVAVVITIVFAILKHTIGLRVTPEEEITGLDVSEHGLLTAYAGFAMLPDTAAVETDAPVAVTGRVATARAPPPLPIQLLEPWVAVRIPADRHHGRDLVKDGQRHANPYHSVEQQRRQVGAEPEQQVVAPADCRHAQQTPQQGVLQADIAVQIELFIGVVPPAAVVDPFQQFGGQPLHHRGIDHAAEEQCRQAGALVVQADGDEHPCRAVHKAEGAGGYAAVGEPAALCSCNNGLAYPA